VVNAEAMASKAKILVLSYDKCGTCKKALKWLRDAELEVSVRPIVDEPPSRKELDRWIAQSGKPVRKWLNTSGLSYRALGKAKIDAASEQELVDWLSQDGKLIKRPVIVAGDRVLVGYDEAGMKALLP